MALGEITKQLAMQAIGNVTSPTPVQPETLGGAILSQIQAMQKALKEDQELVVSCLIGVEVIRITELFSPASGVLVLTGLDKDRNVSRIVAAASAVQLLCKPVQAAAGVKGARLRFVLPRPKVE